MADTKDFWNNLGVGGYSALNSIGLGLPDFLVKNISSDSYKKIKAEREKYKEAATVGDIAGTVGSMFIPGGAITKLVGGGAKALGAAKVASKLDKVADIASGAVKLGKGGFAQGAARGLAGAAEQAIPRLITEAGTTGDLSTASQNAAMGLAGGALGGGLMGKLGRGVSAKKAGQFIEDARDTSGRAYAGTMGIDSRSVMKDMRRNITGGLGRSNKVDTREAEQLKNLINTGDKYDIKSPIGRGENIENALASVGGEYDRMFDAASRSNPKLISQVMAKTKQSLAQFGNDEGVQKVQNLINKYTKGSKDISKLRNAMSDRIGKMSRANLSVDDVAELDALKTARNILEESIDEASGGSMSKISKEYRALKQFQESDFRTDTAREYNVPVAGSPTQPRTAAEKLIKNAMTGAALGGGAGTVKDLAEGRDVDLGTIAASGLGGAVLGGATNKIIPKLMQSGSASKYKILDKLSPLAENLKTSNMQLGGIGDELGGTLAQKAGALAGMQKPLQPELFDEQSLQPDQEAPVAEVQPSNETFANNVVNKLQADYDRMGLADQGIDFNEFVEVVRQKTDNFDPRKSAKVLYAGDEKAQAKYVSDLDKAEKINELDLRLAKAQGGLFGIGKAKGADKAKGDLEGVFFSILSNNGEKSVSRDTRDMVKDQINDILSIGQTPEEQKEMLLSLLNDQYGVNIRELRDRGLV